MTRGDTSGESPLQRLARLIREARTELGWTQDDLAAASGVSRPTIQRYENAKVAPEFELVRAIVMALKVDPREVPVALGLVTREEMGLPAERPRARQYDPTTEDILTMLADPRYTDAEKVALRELLRAQLASRPQSPRPANRPAKAG